ncbi:Bax inhibitor-1/YccA family protein [Rubeoparvulum massiliense]|uniref:Bax inhibitor-1/YccA family protein n=1 Tax=Rubeoparvulum massiliense TaxID=1631346 RepID=UPI00065E73B5|nr:Bax inhibitor-1/YccA family protein [Rubeoparvulum massiliense]
MYQQSTEVITSTSNDSLIERVLRGVGIAFLLTMLGMVASYFVFGQNIQLANQFGMIAGFIGLGLLLFTYFIRKSSAISYKFVWTFAVIEGFAIYPLIFIYTQVLGGAIVTACFGLASAIFIGLSIYAWKSKRDFTFMGSMLMVTLIVLIIAGIANIFLSLSALGTIIAAVSLIVFSGFILYDVSILKQTGFTEAMIPALILSMYLNFINIFLDLLRLAWALFADE